MKTQYTVAVIAIIAAISVISVTAYSSPSTISATSTNSANTGLMMYGHVELIARDSDGNIKQYLQTDNEITREGTNCIVQKLFRTDFFAGDAVSGCLGNPGVFDTIYIGTGTPGGLNSTAQVSFITNATQLFVNPIADSSVLLGNNTGGTGATALISAQFTKTSAVSTETIRQAALINATSAEDPNLSEAQTMAYREFSGIALSQNDQLTINWTITVANDST
jgi:hypothetical protein